MSGIELAEYIARVRRETEELTVPTGPVRRAEATDLDYVLQVTRNGIVWVDDSVSNGTYSLSEGIRAACERARELTSFLYACGASHESWRHWAALASFGLLFPESDDPQHQALAEAVQYGMLAGEWELVSALSGLEPSLFDRYADRVLWSLAVGRNEFDKPPGDDDTAEVWLSFGKAVIEGHHSATSLALRTIAEVHIDIFGDGWRRFLPWTHPLFDLEAASGAALARKRDLVAENDFPETVRSYLNPGLAFGEPTRLYPDEWPQPSPVSLSPTT